MSFSSGSSLEPSLSLNTRGRGRGIAKKEGKSGEREGRCCRHELGNSELLYSSSDSLQISLPSLVGLLYRSLPHYGRIDSAAESFLHSSHSYTFSGWPPALDLTSFCFRDRERRSELCWFLISFFCNLLVFHFFFFHGSSIYQYF